MVKNTFGGSSHKKFARSSTAPPTKTFLRTVREEGELYAYVNKMFGNGMCNVVDMNGVEYMCVIRGKFRGKNRKNNKLEIGTWVLVGLRGWESTKKDAKLTCDLLEIYTKDEMDRLKSTVRGNWKTTCDEIGGGGGGGGDEEVMLENGVVFSANDDAFEYDEMVRSGAVDASKKITMSITTASKNDWLCDDGEETAEAEGEGEAGLMAPSIEPVANRNKKEKNGHRNVTRRIEEYIDFDSI